MGLLQVWIVRARREVCCLPSCCGWCAGTEAESSAPRPGMLLRYCWLVVVGGSFGRAVCVAPGVGSGGDVCRTAV